MERYRVSKLLAVTLLMWSMHSFLFIHHTTFSLSRSHCRATVASKFAVNAIRIENQFMLRAVCIFCVHVQCELATKTWLEAFSSNLANSAHTDSTIQFSSSWSLSAVPPCSGNAHLAVPPGHRPDTVGLFVGVPWRKLMMKSWFARWNRNRIILFSCAKKKILDFDSVMEQHSTLGPESGGCIGLGWVCTVN